MLLISHIIIALSSVIFATYLIFSPSQKKLKVSYGLVGLTLASGTALVAIANSNVLQACTTGLIYVSVVSVCIATARYRLNRSETVRK